MSRGKESIPANKDANEHKTDFPTFEYFCVSLLKSCERRLLEHRVALRKTMACLINAVCDLFMNARFHSATQGH